MWLVVGLFACLGLGIGLGTQQKRVVGVRREIRRRDKRWEDRLTEVKRRAVEEIRREHERRIAERTSLQDAAKVAAEDFQLRINAMSERIIELASRPPVVLPAPSQPDLSDLIRAIGKAVGEVAYGPERAPMTEQQIQQQTYELTRNLNAETLGAPSGDWMPDVEMDEWMEEHGVPNRPGWVAGTGEPLMQASPDQADLPPGMMQAPRPNGDTRMFAPGQSAPPPHGGVE